MVQLHITVGNDIHQNNDSRLHNKLLHLTAISLRSIAAGELCRYTVNIY